MSEVIPSKQMSGNFKYCKCNLKQWLTNKPAQPWWGKGDREGKEEGRREGGREDRRVLNSIFTQNGPWVKCLDATLQSNDQQRLRSER